MENFVAAIIGLAFCYSLYVVGHLLVKALRALTESKYIIDGPDPSTSTPIELTAFLRALGHKVTDKKIVTRAYFLSFWLSRYDIDIHMDIEDFSRLTITANNEQATEIALRLPSEYTMRKFDYLPVRALNLILNCFGLHVVHADGV